MAVVTEGKCLSNKPVMGTGALWDVAHSVENLSLRMRKE